MLISLAKNRGFRWFARNGVHAKGHLFDRSDRFFENESLLDYFATVDDLAGFRRKVLEANGAFAVLIDTARSVLAAVDRLRSIPLFYRDDAADRAISDRAAPLLKSPADHEIDPVAAEEFLRISHTHGASTLHPAIKQLRAAELLCHDKISRRTSVEPYFSHVHGDYVDQTAEELCGELDRIYQRVIHRLIVSAQGRTLAVPLSGGYDSRSLVCLLKRAGYENVVCYTYGTPRSFEHVVARDVAAQLGYPIHFVEYSRPKWKALFDAPWFLEFVDYAWEHCASPNPQELVALDELARGKVIPPDALIVPGFSADLLGGSWVPPEVRRDQTEQLLREGMDAYLYRSNYVLSYRKLDPAIKRALLDRLHGLTRRYHEADAQDFCSAVQEWCTTERVAKFVVNIMRQYEWFGHAWRLPLWDNQLMEWWYRVPLRFRIDSVLYHQYLFERLFNPAQVGFYKPPLYHQDWVGRPGDASFGGKNTRWSQWRWQNVLKKVLPNWLVRAVRPINIRTFAKGVFLDVNGFDDAAALLRAKVPKEKKIDRYTPMNGALAEWLLVKYRDSGKTP